MHPYLYQGLILHSRMYALNQSELTKLLHIYVLDNFLKI